MRHVHCPAALTVLILASLCSPGRAQFESSPASSRAVAPGIVVAGVGIVKVLPDQLRKLKLANLQINDKSLSLSSGATQAAMMGGAQGDSSSQIEISGTLRIELTNLQDQSREDILKTLGKVLDTIKDAGGNLGPSSSDMMAMRYGIMPSSTTVRFMVREFKRLREKAYEQAVEDARVRGSRLANLNGVKLGQVTAVHEIQVAGDAPEKPAQRMPWYWGGTTETPVEQDEISTDLLGDVPVTVRLMVHFEIAQADAPPSTDKPQ
jgi:uncharacterized protein YggE